MTGIGGRLVHAMLATALVALYVWHGGRSTLFLAAMAVIMWVYGLLLHMLGPRRIRIRRHLHSDRIAVGDAVRVRVELAFDCPIPLLWIVVSDNTPAGMHRKWFFPGMKRHFSYEYEINGLRRGVHPWCPGRLYWGDAFGWNTASSVTKGSEPIVVTPAVGDGTEIEAGSGWAGSEDGTAHDPHTTDSNGFELREYREGDPLSRIHWKSSARTGKLHTFLPETSPCASIAVLLYEGRTGYQAQNREQHDHPGFERAVQMAARRIHDADMGHIPLRLWLEGKEPGIDDDDRPFPRHAESVEDSLERALYRLAHARLGRSPAGPDRLETRMLENLPQGSDIVVFAGKPDQALVEWIHRAADDGFRVELHLTEHMAGNVSIGPNEGIREVKPGHADPIKENAKSTETWLEQLRLCGVRIVAGPAVSGSLSLPGKAVVVDVGA